MSENDWQQAWEQDKYEVGRAMHEGWKRHKIANGFADHPWKPLMSLGNPTGWCAAQRATCRHPYERHHDDMIGWDDLPPHQQAINFEGGREGYRLGFEAGARRTPAPEAAAGGEGQG